MQKSILSSLISSVIWIPGTATAAAADGQVVSGNASIVQIGNVTTITQTTDKLVLNFDNFDIGANETVRFVQPSSSAIALNRITGGQTSIFGNLFANGRIILVNNSGIFVANTANIDVSGIIATTLNITNQDFLNSNLQFTKVEGFDAAKIINEGLITAEENGFVVLAGDYVENKGIINARLGDVVLASTKRIALDLQGDGLINFAVDTTAIDSLAGVRNTGSITADGGKVIMTAAVASDLIATAVRNDGLIQAQSIIEENGEIILSATTGDVINTGNLIATGDESVDGGTVKVLGDRVALLGDTTIDVTGKNGGTILVGGDLQGKGDTQTAEVTRVDSNVKLVADALTNGDGGKVIVWADGITAFAGDISAKGGTESGNGGFSEVSGKQTLIFQGDAVLSADNGENGTLLLDPDNIGISSANLPFDETFAQFIPQDASFPTPDELAAFETNIVPGDNVFAFGFLAGQNILIEAADIERLLDNQTNIILQAEQNIAINVGSPILNTDGGNLTLEARGNIAILDDVTLFGGTFTADAGGFIVTDTVGIFADNGVTLTATDIQFGQGNFGDFDSFDIDTVGGDITVSAIGSITLLNNIDFDSAAFGGQSAGKTSGDVTLSATTINGEDAGIIITSSDVGTVADIVIDANFDGNGEIGFVNSLDLFAGADSSTDAGNIVLSSGIIDGEILTESKNLTINGALEAQDMTLTTSGLLTVTEQITAFQDFDVTAKNVRIEQGITAEVIDIFAAENATISGDILVANGAGVSSGGFGFFDLQANISLDLNANINSEADVFIKSGSTSITGEILSAGAINIESSDLTIDAVLNTASTIVINTTAASTIAGSLSAIGSISIDTREFGGQALVISTSDLTVDASLTTRFGGIVIEAEDLNVTGQIASGESIEINAASVTINSDAAASRFFNVNAENIFLSGTFSAGDFDFDSAVFDGQNVLLSGGSVELNGNFITARSEISSGEFFVISENIDINASIQADVIDLETQEFDANGDLINIGNIVIAGDFVAADSFLASAERTTSSADITAQDITFQNEFNNGRQFVAGSIDITGGALTAESVLTLNGNSINAIADFAANEIFVRTFSTDNTGQFLAGTLTLLGVVNSQDDVDFQVGDTDINAAFNIGADFDLFSTEDVVIAGSIDAVDIVVETLGDIKMDGRFTATGTGNAELGIDAFEIEADGNARLTGTFEALNGSLDVEVDGTGLLVGDFSAADVLGIEGEAELITLDGQFAANRINIVNDETDDTGVVTIGFGDVNITNNSRLASGTLEILNVRNLNINADIVTSGDVDINTEFFDGEGVLVDGGSVSLAGSIVSGDEVNVNSSSINVAADISAVSDLFFETRIIDTDGNLTSGDLTVTGSVFETEVGAITLNSGNVNISGAILDSGFFIALDSRSFDNGGTLLEGGQFH
ncbi:MAG: filamentous hemagglutinin N-terminal domain-containing protein [Methylococcales bacterium]|jgi:filamentous hemagglutinin family protein|nr:filamentous hemagglutinin N-terminal domain-containing protein [Methylococcales bacterium]MBT7445461.1 filamentous hemagglutinin N-terminal domain-containing protein [Methylococcales bacterium]